MTRLPNVGPAPTPGDTCYRCTTAPVDPTTPGPGLCAPCLETVTATANRNRRHAAEARADITMSRRNRWAAL